MKKIKEIIKNIFIILVIIILFELVQNYQLAKTEYKTYKYTVSNQDTLWKIANKISNNNKNINTIIIDIKEINNLKDSQIFVGQTLKLPIY